MPKNRTEPGSPQRASSGFTLIEALVALAIAALGLGALMAATAQGLGNLAAADKYIEATRRAQTHLASVGVMQPVTTGEWSGDDGGGYVWRIQMQPVSAADPKIPANLFLVEVSVTWNSDGKAKTVSLRTQRLGSPNG